MGRRLEEAGIVVLPAEMGIPGILQPPFCIDTSDGQQSFGLQQQVLALPVGEFGIPGKDAITVFRPHLALE